MDYPQMHLKFSSEALLIGKFYFYKYEEKPYSETIRKSCCLSCLPMLDTKILIVIVNLEHSSFRCLHKFKDKVVLQFGTLK